MSLNVELLRSSFAVAAERQPELTNRFYELLFEAHPEVKPMFKSRSQPEQAKMLQEALVGVVEHLEDAPWLAETLGALGKRHVGYGVTPEMYDWVGAALIGALSEAVGDDWTDGHASAWGEAYGAIVSLALTGADS